MLPKIVGEFHDEPYIYVVSQCPPEYCLLIMKGRSSNFIMRNLGVPISTKSSKLTSPSNGASPYHVPPDMVRWGHSITSAAFLPKMHNLNLIMKHQTKPKWGTFYKWTGLYSSKCQGQERQKMTEELFQVKGGNVLMAKCSVWSWSGSWTEAKKPHGWDNDTICIWTEN